MNVNFVFGMRRCNTYDRGWDSFGREAQHFKLLLHNMINSTSRRADAISDEFPNSRRRRGGIVCPLRQTRKVWVDADQFGTSRRSIDFFDVGCWCGKDLCGESESRENDSDAGELHYCGWCLVVFVECVMQQARVVVWLGWDCSDWVALVCEWRVRIMYYSTR